MIKDYNFLGVKFSKHLQLFERTHYHATRKNLENRTQLDQPVECISGGDPLLLYRNLLLLFCPMVRFLFALCLESRRNCKSILDVGTLEFLRPRKCLTISFRNISLCFGSKAKRQVSYPVMMLLKICLNQPSR